MIAGSFVGRPGLQSMPARTMSLTEELVARCYRAVEDAGPDPDAQHLSDDDYEAMLDAFEAELVLPPLPPPPLPVFVSRTAVPGTTVIVSAAIARDAPTVFS